MWNVAIAGDNLCLIINRQQSVDISVRPKELEVVVIKPLQRAILATPQVAREHNKQRQDDYGVRKRIESALLISNDGSMEVRDRLILRRY